jgi:hypothetical protein
MIDYDKLKVAHTMIERYALDKEWDINLSARFDSFDTKRFGWILSDGNGDHRFGNIDDLITNLRKLTQTEPKYKCGDIIWIVYEQNPLCFVVEEVNFRSNNKFMYRLSGEYPGAAFEENLYPTKSQLIESQIEYWSNMREPQDEYCNVSGAKLGRREECNHELMSKYGDCGECGLQIECDHESDWNQFKKEDDGYKFKCIKCGEFYR